jgi:autotransporter-associated beta strand protein
MVCCPAPSAIHPSVVISAGATLRFNRGSSKSFFDNISGAGGITVANTPTAIVRLVSDNTYTGPTTISSGTLMIGQGNPSQPGSIASSVVNNSSALVFNRVEDLTYAGAVNGTGTLTKQAAGRLVLTGTHTYTGATTVSAGTLLVNGTIGASAVTVTGGTLGGGGTINGPVSIQSVGRLAPGTSIGVLTISNSLALLGATVMELNAATRTNDVVRGLTTVTYGGTLTLSNLGRDHDRFERLQTIQCETAIRGVFSALTPAAPGPNLAWNTNTLATDGTLRIVSTSPVTMSNSRSGNLVTFSWPEDHIGWRLQAQTNSTGVGLSTNWFTVPNSIATNQMSFVIDPIPGCVFYRLLYP